MASARLTHLLDSVIVIDHFNGIEEATAYLARMKDRLTISVITRAEVSTGFSPDQFSFVEVPYRL